MLLVLLLPLLVHSGLGWHCQLPRASTDRVLAVKVLVHMAQVVTVGFWRFE